MKTDARADIGPVPPRHASALAGVLLAIVVSEPARSHEGHVHPSTADEPTTASPSEPSEGAHDGLAILRPTLQPASSGSGSAAGYIVIGNGGTRVERLLAARAPFASVVSVEPLDIPPGTIVRLVPDGVHLVFDDLIEPLVDGATVPVTLSFERAGDVVVTFDVTAPDG